MFGAGVMDSAIKYLPGWTGLADGQFSNYWRIGCMVDCGALADRIGEPRRKANENCALKSRSVHMSFVIDGRSSQ